MKVKIERTGEVFNVDEYAIIDLKQYDRYGNPVRASLKDVVFIQETTEDTNKEDEHWKELRERAAIAAMQGLLSYQTKAVNTDKYAKAAVNFADALIEELKRNNHETA